MYSIIPRFLIVIMALICVPVGFAESPSEHELTRLRAVRDKAVADAAEPINRRYKESLDQLYRRALDVHDLDAAAKIEAELKQLGFEVPLGPAETAPTVISDAAFVSHLLKQSWTWTSRPGGRDRLDFKKDGSVVHNGWKDATWVSRKPRTIIITMGGTKATLRFNEAMTGFEGVDFGGTHPVKGEHY